MSQPPIEILDDELIGSMVGTLGKLQAEVEKWKHLANEAYSVAKQMADRMEKCTCGARDGL